MRTNYKILSSLAFLIFLGTISCKQKSLEEELDLWCQCNRITQNPRDCDAIIESIVEREEYNPSAIKTIRQKILECEQ